MSLFKKCYLITVQNMNSDNIQPETRVTLGKTRNVWDMWDDLEAKCNLQNLESKLKANIKTDWKIVDIKPV
jgi:hypothetical protein